VLFASPNSVARSGRPRTPMDLIKQDNVHESHRPSPMQWRFRTSGRGKVVRITPRFMATEIAAILLAVKAGRGIGRTLSYQVVDDFVSGALVRLLREREPSAWPVHLCQPGDICHETLRASLDVAAPALSRLRSMSN
jgi:DNA-binding transcriptional LysR family regulator